MWINIVACGFLLDKPTSESSNEDVVLKEDSQSAILVEDEDWKQLEGSWMLLTPKGNRHALTLLCEGESQTLIFSNRQGKAFFSMIKGDEIPLETEIVTLDYQQEVYLLDELNSQKSFQFHLEEGVLQYENELYLRDKLQYTVERIYPSDKECGAVETFSLLQTEAKGMSGEWKHQDCGPTVIQIQDDTFSFAGEEDPIVALNKEADDVYWLTIQNGKQLNGMRIERKQERLILRNGAFPSWDELELVRSTECK